MEETAWQQFREFVAEYRAIFASESALVVVAGMTDTTGREAHNLALSQARADAGKAAILEILGDLVGVPEERIVAIRFGEAPARQDRALAGFPDEQRGIVGFLRDATPTVADGTDDPSWRRVVIFVNDLVSFELRSPPATKPLPRLTRGVGSDRLVPEVEATSDSRRENAPARPPSA